MTTTMTTTVNRDANKLMDGLTNTEREGGHVHKVVQRAQAAIKFKAKMSDAKELQQRRAMKNRMTGVTPEAGVLDTTHTFNHSHAHAHAHAHAHNTSFAA